MSTATTAPTAPVGDERLYEVVNGVVVEKPAMGAYETWIASHILGLLRDSGVVRRVGRGITECLFTIDATGKLKRRPDFAFVSYERWPRNRPVPRAESWDVVPDLAVDVVSPSNTAGEVVAKVRDYFGAGVSAVWVIYTEPRAVYAYQSPSDVTILFPGDTLDGGPALPGFRVPVATLFEDGGELEPGPASDS